jgi:hypothetical protein
VKAGRSLDCSAVVMPMMRRAGPSPPVKGVYQPGIPVAVSARVLVPPAHAVTFELRPGPPVDADLTHERPFGESSRTRHVVRAYDSSRTCRTASTTVAETLLLAILTSVGEIDPFGTRKDGLDTFLDRKVEEGYTIETRTDTHAIISRRPKGLKRFTSGADPGRYVVEVDENGTAKMRPAEPRRA